MNFWDTVVNVVTTAATDGANAVREGLEDVRDAVDDFIDDARETVVAPVVAIYLGVMSAVGAVGTVVAIAIGFVDAVVSVTTGIFASAMRFAERVVANLLSLIIGFVGGFIGLAQLVDATDQVRRRIDDGFWNFFMRTVTRVRAIIETIFGAGGDLVSVAADGVAGTAHHAFCVVVRRYGTPKPTETRPADPMKALHALLRASARRDLTEYARTVNEDQARELRRWVDEVLVAAANDDGSCGRATALVRLAPSGMFRRPRRAYRGPRRKLCCG